ncbi:MAG: Cof-type HAD-IIB family hydrolase [Clostridiales bacterium]|nr:Cof-type HAD-IIB family hydrolase [Clostridiales bacterium]
MDFSDVLLTVDYDRTLTAPDSTIPERNLEAIRHFIDHGGAFTVNTGRSVPMAKPFMELVPVNAPLLLYNGSAAYDVTTGKLDFCHEIPLDLWETVNTARTLLPDLTVEVQGQKAHYTYPENSAWEAFYRRQKCACRFVQPGDDLGTFLKFSIYGAFHDDTVNSLFSGTEEEVRRMDEAEALMKQTFGPYCEVFRAAARIIDIHAKGVSKARSARELQARLGRKILVCAGDADNDLSMMRDADFAYAPADAHIADQFETVCNCASGAVADVIFEKIPGILKKLG